MPPLTEVAGYFQNLHSNGGSKLVPRSGKVTVPASVIRPEKSFGPPAPTFEATRALGRHVIRAASLETRGDLAGRTLDDAKSNSSDRQVRGSGNELEVEGLDGVLSVPAPRRAGQNSFWGDDDIVLTAPARQIVYRRRR